MAVQSPTRYVTPYKYAKLCGVSPTAINQRINRGVLVAEDITNPVDGSVKRYIDTEKFPPEETIADIREYPRGEKK